MNEAAKKFYIVATPIGNLSDMTFRAVEILKSVDVILCEDTRVTGVLLKHYGITTKTMSYHAQSSDQKSDKILGMVADGETLALVSDAGTPTISDPGVKLVSDLYSHFDLEVEVISIPGATAVTTAVSVAGFAGNQFTFYGFLPHKKGRMKLFQEMLESSRVSVFYESPHRLMKTLTSLREMFEEHAPSRKICVARELTKMYEQKVRGTATEVFNYFKEHEEHVRGEFVVVIEG